MTNPTADEFRAAHQSANRSEWLATRKPYIGSSESRILYGLGFKKETMNLFEMQPLNCERYKIEWVGLGFGWALVYYGDERPKIVCYYRNRRQAERIKAAMTK